MDWLDLESRFRRLTDALRFVRLDIQTGAAGDHFRLAGVHDRHIVAEFKSIAKIAGREIRESGGTGDPRIDDEPDPLTRWYRALQHLSGLGRTGPYAQQIDDEGNPAGMIFTASVDRVAEASATLCLSLHDRLEAQTETEPRESAANEEPSETSSADLPDSRKVFVVHGRDLRLKEDLFGFLKSVGLSPIEWSEAVRITGEGSPYIGTILEAAFSSAQAIVVLLTPDDEVKLRADLYQDDDGPIETNLALQARPNVLFEAGMALGRSPDRTVLVEVGPVKPFSDVAGRHVVRLTNSEDRRRDLLERLETAGCLIDMETEEWKGIGDFIPSELEASQSVPETESEPSVRWVDLEYPADSGLKERLESQGFTVRWSDQHNLARRLDNEGWSLVVDENARAQRSMLKSRAQGADLTLIKRPRVQPHFVPNPRVLRRRSEQELRVLQTPQQVLERELTRELQQAEELEGQRFMVSSSGTLVEVTFLPDDLHGPAKRIMRIEFDVHDAPAEAKRIAREVLDAAAEKEGS